MSRASSAARPGRDPGLPESHPAATCQEACRCRPMSASSSATSGSAAAAWQTWYIGPARSVLARPTSRQMSSMLDASGADLASSALGRRDAGISSWSPAAATSTAVLRIAAFDPKAR
ncbi:MAG TPA: hypothetical protein VIZ43_03640 [Trebonia sp.]